jgi:hypothetical protein
MADKVERPEIVDDEHLEYLDELRDSGQTNMFGSPAYVADEFDVGERDARIIVKYWMATFGNDDR